MSSPRGREVLRGNLLHKRKSGSWKKRVVAAFCGVQSSDKSVKSAPAQLQLYEDYEKVEKPGQKPKNSIPLNEAKIQSSYTSASDNSATMVVPETSRLSVSPSTPGSSHSGSGIVGSGSGTIGSGSGTFTTGMHMFTIITQGGEAHEFRTESENDRLRWVKLLQLLVMFPYSSIPKEPSSDPFKKVFRERPDPKLYNADSAWLVYILPEEVGSKCSVIGTNVIALSSTSPNGTPNGSIGKLDIYNPAHPSTPLVSWDRDKMRRTGKTGPLVFIEIGRRCQGGPGLVWMYTDGNYAQALRETLHNFLFQGDGKAVAIPTQQGPIYDVPRASFDSSLPPSYQKGGSVHSGYHNHVLSRSRSHDHDSGCPASPGSSFNTPPQLEGPPVRLDKHPSIRRKNATKPCDIIKRSNSKDSPNGSCASSRSVDSAIDPVFEQEDSSNDQSRSHSPPEECDGEIIGPMDPDSSISFYDEVPAVPRRSQTIPASQGMQDRVVLPGRAHSTASCTMEYERMTHPKDSAMFKRDGYVFMQPRDMPRSAPIPVDNSSTYNQLNHFPQRQSPQQNGGVPRSRNSYDTLPTISEGKRHIDASVDPERPTNYENHPLPQDLQGVSFHAYKPAYENVEKARRDRRGSQNQDQYENVTANGDQMTGPSPSANANGNNNRERKRLSLRRKSSDKEQVKLSNGSGPSINGKEVKTPSPPRNGMNGLLHNVDGYLVVQSEQGKSNYETNPTIRPVEYTAVNFTSTDVIHDMRARRADQKALITNEDHTSAAPSPTHRFEPRH